MRTLTAVGLAMVVAGCATPSADVQPSYVSPMQYSHLRCDQIAREAHAVSARAAQLSGQQDAQRTSDSVMTGVAVVVFWPALFAIGGDDATTAELARMKGEMEALRRASNEKDCGIVFREAPLPEASAERLDSTQCSPSVRSEPGTTPC